ncbi:MAG: hypothetical protein A2189_04100, partial [Paenibacillus sp. RIFOXYA1_FULL_44_5]
TMSVLPEENVANKHLIQAIHRLRKDALVYSVAVFSSALVNILFIMIFTRVFSTREYGHYALTLTSVGFVSALVSQWIIQSVKRYRPSYRLNFRIDGFNRNLYKLTSVAMLSMLILSIAFYYVTKYVFRHYFAYYWMAEILIYGNVVYSIGTTVLQSDQKATSYRTYQMVVAFLRLGLSLIFVLFVEKDITSLLWASILSVLIPIPALLKSTGVFERNSSKFFNEEFVDFSKKFLQYGLPLMGWFLGTSLLSLSDRYLLQVFRSSQDVGVYSATFSLVSSSLGLIASPILTAANPAIMNMSHMGSDYIRKVIKAFSRVFLLIVIPLIIFVWISRFALVDILLGVPYRSGATIMPLLLVGYMMWNFSMFGHKGFELMHKTNVMLILVAVSATVNVLVNLISIPIWGYTGAAWGSLIG